MIEALIFMGAEDKMFLWLVSQTHFANKNGLSVGVRDNMSILAQGRNGDNRSIDAAIGDHNVVDAATRKTLRRKLLSDYSEDSDIPIFYTNLGNHQLGQMPDLSHLRDPKGEDPWDE